METQVSQTFNNGNAEFQWKRGVVMPAKADGLWDPIPALAGMVPVTREDITHMQSRVHQFHATAPVPESVVANVPNCRESFCRWLLVEAAEFASRHVERPLRELPGRAVPVLPLVQPGAGAGQELAARADHIAG